MAGLFITLEGGDGTGKSTQARLICAQLDRQGLPYLWTREPGGTPFGEAIRELLLDVATGPLSAGAEVLLYAAARSELVARVIRPALQEGKIVICDRYIDSSIVYQGYAAGGDPAFIQSLNERVTGGLTPHLTLLYDLPAGGSRSPKQKDRIELRGENYHLQVRFGYLKLARANPQRIKIINAQQPAGEVLAEAWVYIERLLKDKGFTAPGC